MGNTGRLRLPLYRRADITKPAAFFFIYNHDVQVKSYAPTTLERVAFMNDPGLEDPRVMEDREAYTMVIIKDLALAMAEIKPIIELPYNSYIAFCIAAYIKRAQAEIPIDRFFQLSFFHNDEDTLKCIPERPYYCLQEKEFLIESMLNFHDIKKIEIPYGDIITDTFFNEQLKAPA